MERLRQAEAQSSSKVGAMDTYAGLGVMRAALAATEATVLKRAIAKNEEVDYRRLSTRRGQPSSPVVAQGGGKGGIAFGSAATRAVLLSAGGRNGRRLARQLLPVRCRMNGPRRGQMCDS